MEVYLVGGAVRDALMGLPVKDRDYVVVGATPQMLLDQGFVAVGRDFPVFLHPRTHEEYALARTERKTAPGYRGFAVHAAPEVTLEEDLARRDLTINSIAVRAYSTRAEGILNAKVSTDVASWSTDGSLVDPYRGREDIAAKVLRHVTPAFREDPVRILRLARFAARFADFALAPETLALAQEMVRDGETDHLVPERVWQELSTGLMEAQPRRMFEVLQDCGALARLLPHLDTSEQALRALGCAAAEGYSLAVRYACLAKASDLAASKAQAGALRVPAACSALAQVLVREEVALAAPSAADAAAIVGLLERCDAFRKPDRFAELLQASACRAAAKAQAPALHTVPTQLLEKSLQLAQAVATDLVAANAHSAGASGPEVGQMIRQARVNAVAAGLALGML